MKQRWVRALSGIVLTILMLLTVVLGERPALLERFEYDLYDIRLRHFQTFEKDPRIVIVDIDEDSLREEGRWPWNRSKLALMLNRLFDDYGVAIVGFDMVFSEADQSIDLADLKSWFNRNQHRADLEPLLNDLDSDKLFSQAVKNRPVVLGYLFDRSAKQLKVGSPGTPVVIPDPILDQLPLPEANGVISSLRELNNVSVWNGFFDNPMVDSDGVYRRVPLLQRYQGNYYPSLALSMLLALFDENDVSPIIETDASGKSHALVAVDAAGLMIPVDQYGAVLVPYRGPQGSFPYVSATDVLTGVADPEVLDGAIVLVGTSAAGLLDLRVTPVSSRYSGVEVHANILSGMLDERIQHQPDYTLGVEFIQLMISGVLLSLLIPRFSVGVSTLLTLGWVVILVGFNLYAWQQMLWVIPLGYTLMLVVVLYLFQQTAGYFFETRNRTLLANQFGQYIPPEVVEELSQQGQDVPLQGESREMTVFFSDIRDFTNLSEQLSPQQLTRLMNIYLTGMTKAIHDSRGTVDKYIGDAVMAFWGAPLQDEKHAKHGLDAALKMLEILPGLNKQLAAEGLPEVKVGMGINTGPMNVGNMGSSFRMAYTVLGDSVNLASRLEGLTKFYNCPLLVSGDLVMQAPEYLCRKLDTVQVKGRNEPVDIYQPVCLREQATDRQLELVDLFEKSVADYQSREWDKAEAGFGNYLQLDPDDPVASIYLQRISEFRTAPPDENWRGVFGHSSK
ncbi:CHASE2 domain-containing protein [Neptuniibacter sp.]|uniref:CHASE2 domain-containing protein n=1 Tax=Neptuniibacter sp. TaxID=1962643 RepID=UPI002604BCC7|nr:adenylate/guanylate cyclase domain-containing protein [Neptuniibacter sp.]MCP4598148.1 adenylate/guanylate cyclase domain-containing protein [Neptuniibacter sp.]